MPAKTKPMPRIEWPLSPSPFMQLYIEAQARLRHELYEALAEARSDRVVFHAAMRDRASDECTPTYLAHRSLRRKWTKKRARNAQRAWYRFHIEVAAALDAVRATRGVLSAHRADV